MEPGNGEALGRPRKEAFGRRCFELLAGLDVFGNRFCHENCSVLSMRRKGEAIRGFEMTVRSSSGEVPVQVSTLELPGSAPGEERSIVHVLQPIDSTARLARALEGLASRDGAAGPGGATSLARSIPSRSCPQLTPRENEVLQCVAAGLQNKEVAQELGISVATARNHIHNILEKLEVHSKLEAVSLAFREGWVTGSRSAEPQPLERLA